MSPVFKLFRSFYRFCGFSVVLSIAIINMRNIDIYKKKKICAHIKNTKYSVNKRK